MWFALIPTHVACLILGYLLSPWLSHRFAMSRDRNKRELEGSEKDRQRRAELRQALEVVYQEFNAGLQNELASAAQLTGLDLVKRVVGLLASPSLFAEISSIYGHLSGLMELRAELRKGYSGTLPPIELSQAAMRELYEARRMIEECLPKIKNELEILKQLDAPESR